MKKFFNSKFMSLTLALVMLLSVSASPVAYAAEVSNDNVQMAENTDAVAPASTNAHKSYYPDSGVSNGVFSGKTSTQAVYNNLPKGYMHIAYSFYGGSTCYLRFYYENQTTPAVTTIGLNASNNTDALTITLPFSGKYRVEVYNPYGNKDSEVIYAFNLYTE
ncbi:MAG: hypothetical protein OSJ66_05070 [Clostridia bacterium]|nr:hypothetical protein [Clostridia bacterium]